MKETKSIIKTFIVLGMIFGLSPAFGVSADHSASDGLAPIDAPPLPVPAPVSAVSSTEADLKVQIDQLQQLADSLTAQVESMEGSLGGFDMPETDNNDHSEGSGEHKAMTSHPTCVFLRSLSVGVVGPDVSCLQKILIDGGYLHIDTPTQYFGPLTKDAVSDWQASKGVSPASGYFGPLSRAKFDALMHAMTADSGAHVKHGDDLGHKHEQFELNGSGMAVPTVDLIVHKDLVSGYNAEIVLTNFDFAPERVSTGHIDGEGHAHIYVNGKKINRVYGHWYYLGELPAGEHKVAVTISTNDHKEIGLNGELVMDEEVVHVGLEEDKTMDHISHQ